jgi:hypothetical protein
MSGCGYDPEIDPEPGARIYRNASTHDRVILRTDFLKQSRTLFFSVVRLNDSTLRLSKEVEVSHVGLVRRVVVQSAEPCPLDPQEICALLGAQLVSAYAALESAFIANFSDLQRVVFKRLYDLVDAHLSVGHHQDCIGRYWFAIKEHNEGVYFFNESTARKVIAYYRDHQHDVWSPMELAIWFLSVAIPYEKTLAAEALRVGHHVGAKWVDSKYLQEGFKMLQAEIWLSGTSDYASDTVCLKDAYALMVACPGDFAEPVMGAIAALKPDLERYFIDGMREWSPYVRLVRMISQQHQVSTAGEFVVNVIAKLGAEIIVRAAQMP